MSLAVRNKIVELLKTVDGIGNVHAYQRFADAQGEMRNFYMYQNGNYSEIRGWYVTRTAQRETKSEVQSTWRIVGLLSLNDAGQSELLINDIADSIVQLFREKYDLDAIIDSTQTNTQSGTQIDNIDTVMFCGVLCHMVQLSLIVVGDAELMVPSNLVAFETFHGDWDMAEQDSQIDAMDDVELEQ